MAVPREYDPYAPQPNQTQSLGASLYQTNLNANVGGVNTILQGATLRTSNFAGRTATVKPGENINAAIGTLKSAGGGILFLQAGTHKLTENIVGASKISIIGEGRDQTILDFGSGAYGIQYVGTSGARLNNFKIESLTIQNSNASAALYVDYAQSFSLNNIRITSCDQRGLEIQRSKALTVVDLLSDLNTGDGMLFDDDSTTYADNFSFINCRFDSNTANGAVFSSASNDLTQGGTVLDCFAIDNGTDGFVVSGVSYIRLVGCSSMLNTKGYNLSGSNFAVVACTSSQNSGDGFETGVGSSGLIIGCDSSADSGEAFDIQSLAAGLTMTGCGGKPLVAPNSLALVYANNGYSRQSMSRSQSMTNTSGSTINIGDVVVLKAVATLAEVTTTTTVGDNKVLGMALETTSNNSVRRFLTEGFTNLLKVDGTTDIAIGDYLSTFSVAGIAAKASVGDTVFAIALEAYTTNDSNGVIDALLISPRKI